MQSNGMQSNAMQSNAKQSNAKQRNAKQSNVLLLVFNFSLACLHVRDSLLIEVAPGLFENGPMRVKSNPHMLKVTPK